MVLLLLACHFYVVFAGQSLLWRDWHSRSYPLNSVDDYFLASFQAGANDSKTVHHRAKFHRLISNSVRRCKREDIFLGLIGANGALVDQYGRITSAARNADAREQSRHDAPVLVREHRS